GVGAAPLPKAERADRIPCVRRALARVQLSRVFSRQLAFELRHRTRLVSARQPDQAAQEVQRHRVESCAARAGVYMGCESGSKLALRFLRQLTRDVHGRSEPVRQWESRKERERLVRGAETLLTPADEREPEVMTPVVGFQRHGALRGGSRVELVADAI